MAPKIVLGAALHPGVTTADDWDEACIAAVHAAVAASPDTFTSTSAHGHGSSRGIVLNPAPGLRAENAAGAFLRLQQLSFSFNDQHLRAPVRPHYNLARPHSHKLLIRGLPGAYALEGVTGALLCCAGLAATPARGQELVAGELLGANMSRAGTPSALPDAAHLVAFVDAPQSDPGLLSLPRAFHIGESTVRISVFDLGDAPADSPSPPSNVGLMDLDSPQAPGGLPDHGSPPGPAPGACPHPAVGLPAPAPAAPSPSPPVEAAPPPGRADPRGGEPARPPAAAPPSGAPHPPGTADRLHWWRRHDAFAGQQGPSRLSAVLQTVTDAAARGRSPTPRAGVGAPSMLPSPGAPPTALPPTSLQEPPPAGPPQGSTMQPGLGCPAAAPHTSATGPVGALPPGPVGPTATGPAGAPAPGPAPTGDRGARSRPRRSHLSRSRSRSPPLPRDPGRRSTPLAPGPPPAGGSAGRRRSRRRDRSRSPHRSRSPRPGPGRGDPCVRGHPAPAPPTGLPPDGVRSSAAPAPSGAPPALAAPLSPGQLAWLHGAVLAGDTPPPWAPAPDSLPAGYHDEFEAYFQTGAHPACRSPAARALLRRAFLQCHPRLASPEDVDPRPVVAAFCRRALLQLDHDVPGPLAEPQRAALLLGKARQALAGQVKSVPLFLYTAIRAGLAAQPEVLGVSETSVQALYHVYQAHLRFLHTALPGLPTNADHASAFTVAALAQLRTSPSAADSHADRPTRRAARGGQK